jgi:DNA polymerase I
MPLLPGWTDRLNEPDSADAAEPVRFVMPQSADFYARTTTQVSTEPAAKAMAEFAAQRPLAWIGFDVQFRYDRPGVVVNRRHTAQDPRSIHPLLLSLALAEPDTSTGGVLYRYVIDLRIPDVLPAVRDVLRLPVCFVGHFVQPELFCLRKLDLPEPAILWDAWVSERALRLGRGHKRYRLTPGADEAAQARASEDAEEEEDFLGSLASACRSHGVACPLATDEERLQRSFQEHQEGAPFTAEQIRYAAASAVAAGQLYPLQVNAATRAGLLHHLTTVEMPWTITNARMIWNGARIDPEKCQRTQQACTRHLAQLEPQLEAVGIRNVRSDQQLTEFFNRVGLLALFRRGGHVSFDKKRLETLQDRHAVIPVIRAARRVHDLLDEKVLTGVFVGGDGRVHPDYRQLGTHSGRQTSRWPNLLGLGRLFRPLVVPDPGRGIGEADWCQIEVGIAAAVYHDDRLVAMFNSGDVYAAMAQHFYRDQLSAADREMAGYTFKKQHGQYRDRMKTCTLGIIYGLTAHGLALYLNTTSIEAAALQEQFLGMFPALRQGLANAAALGGLRGYATTVSGLRRYRAVREAPLSSWERNWLTNQPVQGSGAVVFKAAGNRLDKLYRRYDAWLIIPMHDAFVFEAPLSVLVEVAELTQRVMCETVCDYFPVLKPQVEVNVADSSCWNKDGRSDSLERWLEEPLFRL